MLNQHCWNITDILLIYCWYISDILLIYCCEKKGKCVFSTGNGLLCSKRIQSHGFMVFNIIHMQYSQCSIFSYTKKSFSIIHCWFSVGIPFYKLNIFENLSFSAQNSPAFKTSDWVAFMHIMYYVLLSMLCIMYYALFSKMEIQIDNTLAFKEL